MKSIPVLQNSYDDSHLSPQQVHSWAKLNSLLRKYQQEGVLRHLLSGSEALERYSDDLEILPSSQYGTDIWLSSSGYQLSLEKALALKKAGLVGINLCLDHFDPNQHNDRQRYKHAYGWVLKAADSIRKAKLLLGLKLCPNPEFITKQNLFTYTRLAHTLGVSYVQIMEPVSREYYCNNSTKVESTHLHLLDEFAETINYQQEFQHWPIISLAAPIVGMERSTKKEDPTLYVDAKGALLNC